ncbi:MAG TPA: YcjX family protein [Geminicoccus sp.]|uniref:YcjX family protein n=1 Tax=Geminicoccus sp. TaxID=2024832 RepID=UPI002C0DFC04|nr:YcjX family protein [Geminicoccus sp.]HWL69825.1 YcjX family protein [Geminicoccus sp.]
MRFGSSLFTAIGDELDGLRRGLTDLATGMVRDRTRLAITGLRRSGKTVLTTCLAHHLLEPSGLPFLSVVAENRLDATRLVPLRDLPPFPLEEAVAGLARETPIWPQPTDRLSGLAIEMLYRTGHRLGRLIDPTRRHFIEIVDYPGEWLLDLPLLEHDFRTFSAHALALAERPIRQPAAAAWQELLKEVDPQAPGDPALEARLAEAYRTYLRACQEELGLSFIQPGRFVDRSKIADEELISFCPLPLPASPLPHDSIGARFERRFERYRDELVKPFYRDNFSRFDRQIVLVDLLTALNRGPDHFEDVQESLATVVRSFRYGSGSILTNWLTPKIDRLVFAATKADHIAPSQHAAMKQLLEIMIAPSSRHTRFAGAPHEVLAVAALRSTDVVRTELHGQVLSCLKGRLVETGQETVLFPGELPPDLPEPHDWTSGRFRFRDFAPRRLPRGRNGAASHIRLDQLLEAAVGDRLT